MKQNIIKMFMHINKHRFISYGFALLFVLSIFGVFNTPVKAAVVNNPAQVVTTKSGDSVDLLVPPLQGPGVATRLSSRARSSWPWYITRASGLVAAVTLVILILSGVGLITGYSFRFLEPLTAWATHKALAIVFGLSVLVHGTALLFDRFVPFTIAQALVPFASNYRTLTIGNHHFGSIYTALGIIAFYLILAVIISSLLWIDKKPHTWKALHFLGYLIMIFVFIHALYLGTDLAHGIFRILWIIFGVGVAVAIIDRLRRAGST